MAEPTKIKVLYFDESAVTMSAFINLCGRKDIVEVIGTFQSFSEMAPILKKNNFELLKLLAPDVLVIKVTALNKDLCAELSAIRKGNSVKLVGILCGSCSEDSRVSGCFDYHVNVPIQGGLLCNEDVCERLMYQIKSARLALNMKKYGVEGKWALLPPPIKSEKRWYGHYKLIAIGASAGGTEAVTKVLSGFTADMPPTLIVQHIPENFTDFFANNLDSRVLPRVCVARGGEKLEKGNVYIAGCDKHLEIVRGDDGDFYSKCTLGEKVSGHRPSVDVLFSSVAKAAGAAAVGVILTGMGSDGAQGLLEMREAGAYTIGQDKESSVVYGMPMVAYKMGAVANQLPLGLIAMEIIKAVAHDEREERD